MKEQDFMEFYFINRIEENVNKLLREIPKERTDKNSFFCDGIITSVLNEVERICFLINEEHIKNVKMIEYVKPTLLSIYNVNESHINQQREQNKSVYLEIIKFNTRYKEE